MTATDCREEYRYDAAGRLTERLVFGISKGMGTGQEETGNGDAGRTDARRIDTGRADAGIIGLGSIGNEIHSIHTDEQRLEGSIEKPLAGSLSHAEIGNIRSLREVVCPIELVLSASYQYHYDRQGNTISDGENQYHYDSLNRLTEVEIQNGDLQRNRYDGEGLRTELEENGELTRFLYSGRDVVAEQDGKNNTIRYVRGLELLSSDCECARMYYHYASDELGSITHVTDENGTVLNRYAYDAFGNRTVKEETVQNRFGFTGEICDGLTGQYYLRARFYNPVIGRFLNEDTYYGDGLNLYSYCRNNPVRFVDPSGHWCEGKEGRNASEGNPKSGKKSPLNNQQQSAYDAARAKGLGAAEAYYIATGKNPLNQSGSNYMVEREQKQIMDYYQNSATTSYNKRKGTGNAQQVGSWTHKDVADDMNNNYIPNNKQNLPYIQDINIEQNYLNGVPIQNNAKGSSRVDISITNNVNNNVHVGDIKTGNANYTTRQKNKNANNINGSNNQNGYTFTHQEIKP